MGLLAAAAALTILIVTATSPRATALRGRAPAPHGVVRSSLRTRGVEITPAPWPSANSAQLQTGLSFEHRPGYVEPRALLQPQPATPKVCPQLTQRPPAVPRGDAACNLLTHRDGALLALDAVGFVTARAPSTQSHGPVPAAPWERVMPG